VNGFAAAPAAYGERGAGANSVATRCLATNLSASILERLRFGIPIAASSSAAPNPTPIHTPTFLSPRSVCAIVVIRFSCLAKERFNRGILHLDFDLYQH